MYSGKVVYSHLSELFVRDMATGDTTRYGGVPLMATPAWHPSGESIAFGRTSLYSLDITAQSVTNLTQPGQGDTDPTWSPAGDSLIFTRLKNVMGLYQLDVATGVATHIPLELIGARRAFHPAWSPNGDRLAFALDLDGISQIYTAAIEDLFQPRPVVTALTNGRADSYSPAWSPDGTQIAFSSKQEDGVWAIYVMEASGMNARRITFNPNGDIHPCWSPDGSLIIFEQWDEKMVARLNVMNADGSDITLITPDGGIEPDWIA